MSEETFDPDVFPRNFTLDMTNVRSVGEAVAVLERYAARFAARSTECRNNAIVALASMLESRGLANGARAEIMCRVREWLFAVDRHPLRTNALAALAEARGLRLVEPEHLLDIEAARAEGAAAEREACALEADRFAAIASSNDPDEDDYQRGAMNCAQSLAGRIRARSNGGAR